MSSPQEQKQWTPKELAVNAVIDAVIKEVGNFRGRLIADGDPGLTLEGIAANLDKRAAPLEPGANVSNDHIDAVRMVRAILKVAREVGYKGEEETLMAVLKYLRGLPPEGPIGGA